MDNLQAGVVVHEMDTSIIYANHKALELLRLSWDQMIGRDAIHSEWFFIHENGERMGIEDYPVNQVVRTGKGLNDLVLGVVFSLEESPVWVIVNAYIDQSESVERVVVTFADISSQFEIPFKEIVDKAKDMVIVTEATPIEEPDGPKIVYVNDAFSQISGYSREEVIGKTPRILQGDETSRATLDRIKHRIKNKLPVKEKFINYSKDERPYWIDASIFPLNSGINQQVKYFVAIERDVTDITETVNAHKEAAMRDPLTGLLNRRGFESSVSDNKAALNQSGFSILAVDIDFFKRVNDHHGHSVGDVCLQQLAETLLSVSRKDDLCVRFGGEEFLILLAEKDETLALHVAERLRQTVEDHVFVIDKISLSFTVSVGVAHADKVKQLEACLKQADDALYEAKRLGRNQVVQL